MKHLLRRIAAFLGLLPSSHYRYPAVDVEVEPQRHFHLVGSIHMGTVDMSPLPPALLQQLDGAAALIVEADIADSGSPFDTIGAEPPMAERLTADTLQRLQRLCDELSFSYASLDHLPAWQAALMLQARQAMMLGLRPGYGIDYQLIHAARERTLPIIELEGQQSQMELLLQLPQDGMLLLEDTLHHWHTNARLLQTMVSWWVSDKPVHIGNVPPTFGNQMTEMLMHQRNQRWQQQLLALPAGRYVVAVGALHLYGEGNLSQLLAGNSPPS
ncbi:TraB/GumN family protein [Musicola keenii]|uniref:TraB/GumN family protein n=1 Tax=Musicola keenii TaxID=2884250 RepID=UPI00177E70F8|nr:TraB/GumN family protein [Musicola keenii]